MLKAMKLLGTVVLVAIATPVVAQSEREMCRQFAPTMRQMTTTATALLEEVKAALPNDIEKLVEINGPTLETISAARASAESTVSGPEGKTFGDFAEAAVVLVGPLSQYVQSAGIAATMLEACAAAGN